MRLVACALVGYASQARADDWPQWLGPRRDGVWRETGVISKVTDGRVPLRWRAPVGQGFSGPVVAEGRVVVSDRVLAAGVKNPDDPFTTIPKIAGSERVLAFDAGTGKRLWTHEYPCVYEVSYAAGPRATPTIAGGRVYALGAMGDLVCLDAATGALRWRRSLPRDFKAPVPTWGFAGSPLVEGDRLFVLVGGAGALVVALRTSDGSEIWRALTSSEAGYSSPTLANLDGKPTLIQWHPEGVSALDPATGASLWNVPFARAKRKALKAGMAVATPVVKNGALFVSAFYEGSLMLDLSAQGSPRERWRRIGRSDAPDETEGLHALMATPLLRDGCVYGVCSHGELRCLDATTGERKWDTLAATGGSAKRWSHAFLVDHEDRTFLFNESGELILAKLAPRGYEERGRATLVAPTNTMVDPAGRRVVWAHPAFANRCVYARNDAELACFSLAVTNER